MDLETLGAAHIGAGVFQPAELDVFSCVTGQALLGRITESVGNFYALWPEIHILSIPSRGRAGRACWLRDVCST